MTTIDEVLETQRKPQLFVTVDAVEGAPELVNVTPWSPIGGCNCELSLRLPKDCIAGVLPTQMRHACCGKSFVVVELTCKEGATIAVHDVLEQLTKAAHDHLPHHPEADPHHVAPVVMPQPIVRKAVPCGQQSPRILQAPYPNGASRFRGNLAEQVR